MLFTNVFTPKLSTPSLDKLASVSAIYESRDKAKSFEMVTGKIIATKTAHVNIAIDKEAVAEIVSTRKNANLKNTEQEVQEDELKIISVDAKPLTTQESANQILFADLYPAVDMVKTVVEKGVKENIILKEQPTEKNIIGYQGEGKWVFEYEIQTSLQPKIEKGQVNYYNAQEEAVMYHPAPFMLDSTGLRSEKTYWQLAGKTEKGYLLKLFANTEGLTYPIDLDPTTYVTFTLEENYLQEDVKKTITNWINNGPDAYTNDLKTKLLLHAEGDQSSFEHTLSINGVSSVNATTGKFNGGMSFNGTTNYLSLADSDDWNFGSSDFTVDFWMKRGAINTRQGVI